MLDSEINTLVEKSSTRSKEYTDLKTFEMISRLENSPLFLNNLDRLRALITSLQDIEAKEDSGVLDLDALSAKVVLNSDLILTLETKLDSLITDSEARLEFNTSKFNRIFELIAEQTLIIESLNTNPTGETPSLPVPDYVFYGTGSGLFAKVLYRWDIFLYSSGFRLERFDGVTNSALVFDGSTQVPLTANLCRTLFNK